MSRWDRAQASIDAIKRGVKGRYGGRGFEAGLWKACEDVPQGRIPAFEFTYHGQERDVIFEVKEKK